MKKYLSILITLTIFLLLTIIAIAVLNYPQSTTNLNTKTPTTANQPEVLGAQTIAVQGKEGERGLQGIRGVQGLKGDIGPKGESGDKGEQGINGMDGLNGLNGIDGIAGPQGNKGDTGEQGERGLTGPMGIQGEIGPKGDQGTKGDTGSTGPKGEQGDTGPKGDTGLMGPIGPQGLKGDTGLIGSTGPKGDKGDKGDSAPIQTFLTGILGNDFNISNIDTTLTFNIPDASNTSRGLITTGNQIISGQKTLTNPLLLRSIIQGDYSAGTDANQLVIRGSTDTNQQLELGFNTLGDYATIQAIKQNSNFKPLALNPIGGNVGIGNTNPQTKLHIGNSAVGDGTSLIKLEDINSLCNLNANTGTPSCGSDLNLKKDISTLDTSNLLNKIIQLRPVSYHWKTDDISSPLQFGFIAQEIEQQFPELVKEDVWIDGTKKKFLNTDGLIPYIVGAMKEQQLQIDDLREQIKDLKQIVDSK